jgi:hypothetical protein
VNQFPQGILKYKLNVFHRCHDSGKRLMKAEYGYRCLFLCFTLWSKYEVDPMDKIYGK